MKGKVFLIESEEDIRLAAAEILAMKGVECFAGENPEKTFRRETPNDNDLILSSRKEDNGFGERKAVYIEKPYTARELLNVVRRFV